MKKIESSEEIQKQKLKEIYEKNIEKIKEIQKIQEDINVQKQLLNSWNENVEKMKNNISNTRKENTNIIDNLCGQYSFEDKEFKNITKMYNLLSNITGYKVINIKEEENKEAQEVKGYLLNNKNGDIMDYNIKMKKNESVENKASKVFNFWKTFVNFNENNSN